MNLGLISLICLLAAIVIGFVKNCNVGILCTGIAAVLALVFGIKASDIIKGFSASLCIQMVGITYLFAIINGNGTLELLARKMVALVGKQKRLIPFVIYILGFIISAVGPGAIPSLAIIPVIAIPVAASAGINPIMTAIIGDLGVMSGRMSPLTPEAAVVRELMAALAGLAVGVLFFSWNVGLMGFLMGSLLIIFGCGDEKKAVQMVPWNVIIMVLGVGILMNVISLSGGIDIMVAALEHVMSKRTAAMIMGITSGFMSFFSSGLGVVFPTLIPTASGLASTLGADAIELVSVIVIGGTIVGFTPISTTGALIMAGVSQQENAEERFPQNRMFVELFAVSFLALAVVAVFSFLGIYHLFV